MHCSGFIGVHRTGTTLKIWKIHKHLLKLSRSSLTLLRVFCKDFINISYDNASFLILEDSIVHGIRAKLVSNGEQNMLYIKS